MPRWEERSKVKTQKITDMLKQNETKDRSVIEAEVMWVNFLVEHGIPFIASEHVGKLFATIFPDSKIAQQFACGKTKAKSIAKALAKEDQIETVKKMKKGPFVIGTDGSNDDGTKYYPIVVKCSISLRQFLAIDVFTFFTQTSQFNCDVLCVVNDIAR